MDTTTTEATVSAMETEKIDEIQNDEKTDDIQIDAANTDNQALQENQHQQRQDFTSETFKIEITNLGKFAFGVCNSFKISLKINF